MVRKEFPSKLERVRMHWICLRRDFRQAWFHIKGISRELCREEHPGMATPERKAA